MKKIKAWLIVAIIVASLIVGTIILLLARQDIAFRISERLASCFREAEYTTIEIPTIKYNLHEIDKIDYNQTLVNSQYRIHGEMTRDLIEIEGHLASKHLLESYNDLQNAIKLKYNQNLKIRSAYRTKEEQRELYESLPSGLAAPVGGSEHELGLALDVFIEGWTGGEILKTDAGRYLHSNCHEYGFIIRYPNGKSDITGISYEPWHIRYVGKPHAEIMYLESLTLEEYLLEFLTPNFYYQIGNYIVSRQIEVDGMIDLPKDYLSLEISDDNCGGYLVTAQITQTN